jgi:hypothetical protein
MTDPVIAAKRPARRGRRGAAAAAKHQLTCFNQSGKL